MNEAVVDSGKEKENDFSKVILQYLFFLLQKGFKIRKNETLAQETECKSIISHVIICQNFIGENYL